VDDKLFNSFTRTDWEYYDAMIYQDEQELDKRIMEGIEYMALFVSPERLQKWHEIREGEPEPTNNQEIGDGSVVSSDMNNEQFASFIASMSPDGVKPKFRKR